MPELPEVEFARRLLVRHLAGTTVRELLVRDARVLTDGRAKLVRALEGRRIDAIERRGKWLRFALGARAPATTKGVGASDPPYLLAHLGMTGKWVHLAHDAPPARFERLRLVMEASPPASKRSRARARGGAPQEATHAMAYCDLRLFGELRLATDGDLVFRDLGPDPLVDGLDARNLATSLAKTRRTIKEALLDQGLVAGIGNIHAQEALFRARIDPRRRASDLDAREVARLVRGIFGTIEDALADVRGETITYVEEPGAENPFAIYGRGGEPCPRCRTALTRIVQGGRSTVFCARCQR